MENNTELGRLLSARLQEQLEEPESTSQMEQVIREEIMEIGRQALAAWLANMEAQGAERKLPCPHCGQEAQYARQREGQRRTVLGVVHYRRAYYRCGQCGNGHYPLDQALGLRVNAMSAELERLAGMTGVQMPFAQGSEIFAELMLVGLSDQSLDKAAQAYGAEVERVEREWQMTSTDEESLLQRKREQRPPLRLL